MLKQIKLITLRTSERLGLSKLLLESEWRRRRLLILCYHGISLEDEHEWDPSLFMPAAGLRQRFAHLRDMGCNLLPFNEAFEKLRDGSLPPKAVSVTFDDGTYDFFVRAMPVIREHAVPTTLFFSTFYSSFNRPIYDLAIDYVLWKARGRRVHFPEVFERELQLDHATRREATRRLRHYAHEENLTPDAKDDLLERLCTASDVDLAHIRRERILHLMTPEEVASVARDGIDIQLHTHRHRVYDDRARFDAAIEENRQRLASIRGGTRDHFCYPGGMYLREFAPWLEQKGIVSATTSHAGLASQGDSPWRLPRFLDSSGLTSTEFAAWVTGVASFLPRRPQYAPRWMLVRGPEIPTNA